MVNPIHHMDHIYPTLDEADPSVAKAIAHELARQQYQIELIASENYVSRAVLMAQGSIMTNKYAEGYPGRRYYGGCDYVDEVEDLARERLKQLFTCRFANVQPHAGAQANGAVFLAFLKPGDTILGMGLPAGGHLTHGAGPNISGQWFHAVAYGVDPVTHLIDYDQVQDLALTHRPKLIIAGGSAYSRIIDFARFRAIADQIDALLMVDMAHFAGLVAGGVYPNPFPHAHVVTSTTHKTLRGPRGGIILTNDESMAKKIDSAVFPGYQGGPLMHVIAAKAVAFGEALTPDFAAYASQVVKNAQAMADVLSKRGYKIMSGGTDSHLILVDVGCQGFTGKDSCAFLEKLGITCNKNSIPNDPLGPTVTSGLRLGSPAMTTRGLGAQDFMRIAEWIADALQAMASNDQAMVEDLTAKVKNLCQTYPIYEWLVP